MSNLDVLHQVAGTGGPLREVSASMLDDCMNELRFVFDDFALVVSADGEYDTVLLAIDDDVREPKTAVRALTDAAWCQPAIGVPLRWGWELTNQQGYADGVRFEFADPNAGTAVVIELIVVASTFHVYRCDRARPAR